MLGPDPVCSLPDRSRVKRLEHAPPGRFDALLAIAVSESVYPGLTTPGTVRPWAFSTLRRFTPPNTSSALFHADTTSRIQRTGQVQVSDSASRTVYPRTFRSRTRSPDGRMTFVTIRLTPHLCCYARPFDSQFTPGHRASAPLTNTPRKQDVWEEDSPTCSSAASKPHEVTFATADAHDEPTSE